MEADTSISIHALLAESDILGALWVLSIQIFLSTLSLRRATEPDGSGIRYTAISIHALLAESDPAPSGNNKNNMNFYPRSPCGERPNLRRNQRQRKQISIHALLAESDIFRKRNTPSHYPFLSTLSLRRATSTSL